MDLLKGASQGEHMVSLQLIGENLSEPRMTAKEARARIKINQLLISAGWRFFDDSGGPANIVLEPKVSGLEIKLPSFSNSSAQYSTWMPAFLQMYS